MQVGDYSGNKTDPVKIPTADEPAKCTVANPTQLDVKKSTLTAVDGSAVVDGKAIRTAQAMVKNSFGSPLVNAEAALELPEGVSAIGGNTTAKTGTAGMASLNVVSTRVGKYTVKTVLNSNAIGKGVTVEFTRVAVTPNKPGDQNKSGDTKPNKSSQNDNKNNDKNGASLSATSSLVTTVVVAMVVLLGAGVVVLRAHGKAEWFAAIRVLILVP